MAQKAEDELTKHTLHLFTGDYDKIRELFPDIGAAVIIRRIVRQYVERVEAQPKAATPDVTVQI